MIEIHDNFLPLPIENNLVNLITNKFVSNFPLYYLKKLSDVDNDNLEHEIGFGHTFYQESHKSCDYIITKFYSQLCTPLYNFFNYKKIFLEELLLGRVYLQRPSITSSALTPHVDFHYPHWVCLYYVNDSDGDTIFYDNNQNEIKRTTPKKGRMVLFDGSIYHSASTPTIDDRIIINYCFHGHIYE